MAFFCLFEIWIVLICVLGIMNYTCRDSRLYYSLPKNSDFFFKQAVIWQNLNQFFLFDAWKLKSHFCLFSLGLSAYCLIYVFWLKLNLIFRYNMVFPPYLFFTDLLLNPFCHLWTFQFTSELCSCPKPWPLTYQSNMKVFSLSYFSCVTLLLLALKLKVMKPGSLPIIIPFYQVLTHLQYLPNFLSLQWP